jgi:nitrogen regulatory protein P-II 1
MITAVVRPDKLRPVLQALESIGITGITVSDVRGHGRQKGHRAFYRGSEHQVDLVPKIRLDIVVRSLHVERVIETITECAQTGRIGDGKVFVMPVDDAIRVRTGERGETAV